MGLRRAVTASSLARLAALPHRTTLVARHDAEILGRSARWLIRSREHTNFTYDLSPLNAEHLAWFVAELTGSSVADVRSYLAELTDDADLRRHVVRSTEASSQRGLADRSARFGRRAGWYAIVRATKPSHVVETGTDKGLGSCVVAAALLRNGSGRLTTIDLNPAAGYLISGVYADVVDRRVGDTLVLLPTLPSVDLFIHDSDHNRDHEAAELELAPLGSDGIALSDNSHVTDVLPAWAESTGRRFLYFHERPLDHWYPGGGIGAAW